MRHGNAGSGKTDHDRPLTSDGETVCRETAKQLLAAGLKPDHVLVSDARRTVHTESIVRKVIGSPAPTPDRDLYLASADGYRLAISRTPDAVKCVLLVAHNPGLSQLASRLRGTPIALQPGDYSIVCGESPNWSEVVS